MEAVFEQSQKERLCCPILFIPSKQKPHNVIRTINLFDTFVAVTALVPATVNFELYPSWIPWSMLMVFSYLMFIHSLLMVMYYNRMVSLGLLVSRSITYQYFRM